MPKPFPLYTDGSNLYTTFDGGATLITLESAGGLVQTAAPVSGDGSVGNKITIAAAALPLTALATQANNTVVGNIAGTASPVALTATQLTALVNPATGSLPGAMTAAQFLALGGAQPSKVLGAGLFAYSDVIDLTTTGTYVVLPPMPFRIGRTSSIFEIKTTNTCTVSPTLSVGSNSASFNNIVASGTFAAFTSGAAETLVSISTTTSIADLTTSGLQLNVTNGATATALTARYVITFVLLPV